MRKAEIETGPTLPPTDWLTTPIEFEDQRSNRIRRNLMRLITVGIAGALLWSGLAPIRELSTAQGQLIPASEVRPVQHFEGGIVDEILVVEGQLVDKDQPLMRLRADGADSDLAALRVRAHNLRLQKGGLTALVAGRSVDVESLGDFNAALLSDHVRLHEVRLNQRAKERTLLLARIAQRKAEIRGLQNQIPTQDKLVGIQKQRLDGRRELASRGTMSKKHVLEVETGYEQARIQSQESERKLAAAMEALSEAEAALAESDAQALKLWSEDLAKASGELAEVEASIRKHADRVERLVLRAPIRGRVQQMVQRSSGEVVRSGEAIARIVPADGGLLAEVRVKPEDIGEVRVGDQADVKVSAFDYGTYGKIRGEVASISPTTFESEDRQFYYKTLIRFDPTHAAEFAPYSRLQPGMTVDADIVSGSKSLLKYMLKPVYRGVDVAFSER